MPTDSFTLLLAVECKFSTLCTAGYFSARHNGEKFSEASYRMNKAGDFRINSELPIAGELIPFAVFKVARCKPNE